MASLGNCGALCFLGTTVSVLKDPSSSLGGLYKVGCHRFVSDKFFCIVCG